MPRPPSLDAAIARSQPDVERFGLLFTEIQNELTALVSKLAILQGEVCQMQSPLMPQPLVQEGTSLVQEGTSSFVEVEFDKLGDRLSWANGSGNYSKQSLDQETTELEEGPMTSLTSLRAFAVDVSHDAVLQTCIEGSDRHVQNAMCRSADPNMRFGPAEVNGMKLQFSTPLAIAVLRDQFNLVKWLIRFSADPDSEYGFKAGAAGIDWSGPCACAAVPRAKMQCLQALIDGRADVQKRSSNGAGLLWQASYFNQVAILEVYMKYSQDPDLEQRAVSQDDVSQSYTPLHAAAKAGNHGIVTALLDAKAYYDPTSASNDLIKLPDGQKVSAVINYSGRSALQDAIASGHVSVVRLLVASGASSLCNRQHHDCLDLAFDSGNAALVAAIAQGLVSSPTDLVDHLTREDLGHFLGSDGEIPSLILQAIFRPSEIKFWAGKKRMTRNVAFLQDAKCMNVALGPHPSKMTQMFKHKEELGDIASFVEAIAPQDRTAGKKMTLCPVKFYVCHIPGIHEHLDVLLALANSPCQQLFEDAPAQAVISFAAQQVRKTLHIRVVMAVIGVLNLGLINVLLDSDVSVIGGSTWPLKCANILGLVISVSDMFTYFLEAVGYWSQSLLRRFVDEWFHGIVLCATCGVMVYTYQIGAEVKSSPVYCTTLGTVIFIKWMELLFEFCQFTHVGMNILPIMSTMLEIGPFCGVMAVCIIASANLYYALGRYNAFDSFVIMYVLSVVGEFELTELSGGETDESDDYYYVVRIMMLFISFMMSITLMNLYIGVLTVNYEAHTKKALASFSRFRASSALEAQAVLGGWNALTKTFCGCVGSRTAERTSLRRLEEEKKNPPSKRKAGRKTTHFARKALSSAALTSSDISEKEANEMFMWVCIGASGENEL